MVKATHKNICKTLGTSKVQSLLKSRGRGRQKKKEKKRKEAEKGTNTSNADVVYPLVKMYIYYKVSIC